MKKLLSIRNLIILGLIVALYVVSGLLGLKIGKPEVSIAAEQIFSVGSFKITNSLLTSWVAMLALIGLSVLATRRIPKDLSAAGNSDLVPKGIQNLMELIVEIMYNLVREVSGARAARFFPIVMTIFLFVIVSNWLGLIPGFGSIGFLSHPHGAEATGYIAQGSVLTAEHAKSAKEGFILVPLFRSPSADLNFTLALALMAVVLSQYFGFRTLKGEYARRFFDVSGFKDGAVIGVAQFAAGLLELIGEFTKIISFSFRLFGNIFAGEVLLAVMAFLIPYVASLPFYGLELFVGFIQAVVFMMLTLVFFVTATTGHGAEEVH